MSSINLKWRDAMAVAGWHFKLAEHDAGWPQSMKPDQVAALQRPYVRGGLEHRPGRWRTEALMKSITDACKSGELIHTAVTEIVTPKPPPVQHRNEFASSDWLGEFGRFGLTGVRNGRITAQPNPQPRDVTTYTVTAPAIAAWLAAQHEEPSPHIQAWFDAVGVAAGAADLDTLPKPLQRTAAQAAAILHELDKQGYDPLALPKNPPGKPGVKAAIRAAIDGEGLFVGKTVFDKSWDSLRAGGDIVDKD